MDTSALSFAFSAVFTPINMLVILGGTILGIFIGAMPGMSSPMGLSIMLPFTFQLHGYAGIMMLLGIFCGSIYGGSISASLLNTPGTAASAATCLDAYPCPCRCGSRGGRWVYPPSHPCAVDCSAAWYWCSALRIWPRLP